MLHITDESVFPEAAYFTPKPQKVVGAVCGVGGGCVRKANKQGRKQKKKSKTVENCSFKLKTALFILSHNNNNSFKYVAIHSLP